MKRIHVLIAVLALSAVALGYDSGARFVDLVTAQTVAGAKTFADDVTTNGEVYVTQDNAATATIVDLTRWTLTSTGTAAAGLGVGVPFYIENAAGASAERASLDIALDVATGGAESASWGFNTAVAGTSRELVRVQGDYALGDQITTLQPTAASNWTDAVTDSAGIPLGLRHTLSSGTPTAGMSVGWVGYLPDSDDAAGVSEVAGVMLTGWDDATAGSEDSYVELLTRAAGAAAEATFKLTGAGQIKATTTTGAWNGDCLAACPETTSVGAFRGSASNGRFGQVVATVNTAGSCAACTDEVTVRVQNVTDASTLCTCSLGAICASAAGTTATCTCAQDYLKDKTYAIQLTTVTTCTGNPALDFNVEHQLLTP